MADYPANPNAVFLTGDSAGGALTLLTLAIENNAEAAAAFGVDSVRHPIRGCRSGVRRVQFGVVGDHGPQADGRV